jgi:chromosome segregation ATPase
MSTHEQLRESILKLKELNERMAYLKADTKVLRMSQDDLWDKIESYQNEAKDIREKIKKNDAEFFELHNKKSDLEDSKEAS